MRSQARAPVWLAAVSLAMLGGVIPVLIAHHFGVLGIPRNDDWSYLLTSFRFGDGGGIAGNGWVSMNLVGQLALSAPVVWLFGHSITALQFEVVCIGVVGLIAAFDLIRQFVSPYRALFVTCMTAVGPLWAPLSVSFMTDVPAFAFGMLCIALGTRSVRGGHLRAATFFAAILAGFAAFSIREYAIVAPAAVIVAAWWASYAWPRSQRNVVRWVSAGFVACALAFYLWRRDLPGFLNTGPHLPGEAALRFSVHFVLLSGALLGLLSFPAVALAGPKHLLQRSWTRAPRVTASLAAALCLGFGVELVRQRHSGFVLGTGNYVTLNGTLGTSTISGIRPDFFPRALWVAFGLLGAASFSLMLIAAIPSVLDVAGRLRAQHRPLRHENQPDPGIVLVALAAAGYALPYFASPVTTLAAFDRYLLPTIPLVSLLVLMCNPTPVGRRRGRGNVGVAVALTTLAALGIVFAANSASFDGTRWAVAEESARRSGSAASAVRGSFEWVDFHAGRERFFSREKRRVAPCIYLRVAPDKPNGSAIAAAKVWGPFDNGGWIVASRRNRC